MKKIYTFIFILTSFSFTAQLEGTWKLSPQAFAMGCGPSQGDGSWWSNGVGDITTRACLFDDSITFSSTGAMIHYMDGNTWLEDFQGVASEQCGSPVAPHDGSASATWAVANNQLTLTGIGAHIGLPKAINGGELVSGDTVPNTRIYEISISNNGDAFTADIQSAGGSGWWRFKYVKTTTADCPNSLPYYNDFETTSCWQFGPPWHTNNGSPGNYWYYSLDNTGNTFAGSDSWTQNQGALSPDCWVVFGPIDMTGVTDANLAWKVRGVDANWCQENYSIYFGNYYYISSLENSPYHYTETINSGGDACGTNWAQRSFTISGYTYNQGYIALRHHGVYDMFQLHIDDLELTSTMSTSEIEYIEMDVYPNPTNNVLNIKSHLKYIGTNYSVIDNSGKVVLTGIITSNLTILNTEVLSEGIYLLSAGDNIKRKFIIIR